MITYVLWMLQSITQADLIPYYLPNSFHATILIYTDQSALIQYAETCFLFHDWVC